MPITFEQELAREQAAVTTAEQIKDSIKTVAENKGLTVKETDTPLSVLTKIDNSTIATPTETISIIQNGTVDVTNYASANVNVTGLDSGLMEGTFQSCGSSSTNYAYNMSGTVSLNSRLYEYLGHSSSMLYLSSSNIYIKDIASIDIGYLNGNFEFVSVGTGSRDSMTINVTFNEQPIPETGGTFVFIKDNVENKIYLVCNYFMGDTIKDITGEKVTLDNSLSHINRAYGMTSPTEIPAGSGSKVCLSHPAWKFWPANQRIESDILCLGITIS